MTAVADDDTQFISLADLDKVCAEVSAKVEAVGAEIRTLRAERAELRSQVLWQQRRLLTIQWPRRCIRR